MPAIRPARIRGLLVPRWVGRTRILLEEPPAYHLYHWRDEIFRLPLPWLYYVFAFKQEQVYNPSTYQYEGAGRGYVEMSCLVASPVRAKTMSSRAARVPLPNFVPRTIGRPCMGGALSDSLEEGVNEAYMTWWGGRGNWDYWPTCHTWKVLFEGANGGERWRNFGFEAPDIVRTRDTFKYWEKLSIDEVTALSWPGSTTMRNITRARTKELLPISQKEHIPA